MPFLDTVYTDVYNAVYGDDNVESCGVYGNVYGDVYGSVYGTCGTIKVYAPPVIGIIVDKQIPCGVVS